MAFEIDSREVTGFAGIENARNEVEYILASQPGGLAAYDLEAIQAAAIIDTGETWGLDQTPVYELSEDFWDVVWANQVEPEEEEEEHFVYDPQTFAPGSDPTYLYDVETVAPAVRDAVAKDRLHAAVEFPPHHGRGPRPYHVRVELTYCGFPGGEVVFDHPTKINQGQVRCIRADGQELEFSAEGMDWDGLCDRLHDFMAEWGTGLCGELQAAHRAFRELQAAEQAVSNAKRRLKVKLRGVKRAGGLPATDIARLVGMSPRTAQAYMK